MKERYIRMIKERFIPGGDGDERLPGWMSFPGIVLYRVTGNVAYRDEILKQLRIALEDYRAIGVIQPGLRLTGFKMPYRLMEQIRLCLAEGLLTEEEKSESLAFLEDLSLEMEYERGAMNRAFGFAGFIAPLLKLIPDHPRRDDLLMIEELVLKDLKAHFEPDEDSYGYCALTMMNLILWIDESGREELYHHPKLKGSFEKMLKIFSGGGRAPIYGDWRPWEPIWGWYIAVFEKAATLYKDGRFKWAARILFEDFQQTILQKPDWFALADIHGLARAWSWGDERVVEEKPCSRSEIIYRNSGTPERAVFREGWDQGDLLAMVSLAGINEHGHRDPLALNGLIGEGVILEDNGRQTVESFFHSTLCYGDGPEDFPVPSPESINDRNLTVRCDFSSHRNYGRFHRESSFPFDYNHFTTYDIPGEFEYDPSKEWVFLAAFRSEMPGMVFKLKCLTLKGKQESRKIYDFDNPGWIGLSGTEEGGDGQIWGLFDLSPGREGVPRGGKGLAYAGFRFPGSLSMDKGPYDSLELEFRLEGAGGGNAMYCLALGEEEGYPRKWMAGEIPQYPVRIESFQESRDFVHGCFSQGETSLTGRKVHRSRELFMTRDAKRNFLWIRDGIEVEDRKPFIAGPLWQLTDAVDLEDGWVEAGCDGRALIKLYLPSRGKAVLKDWKSLNPLGRDVFNSHLLYGEKACSGRKREYFNTLIIPLKKGEDSRKILNEVKVRLNGEDGETVEIDGKSTILFTALRI